MFKIVEKWLMDKVLAECDKRHRISSNLTGIERIRYLTECIARLARHPQRKQIVFFGMTGNTQYSCKESYLAVWLHERAYEISELYDAVSQKGKIPTYESTELLCAMHMDLNRVLYQAKSKELVGLTCCLRRIYARDMPDEYQVLGRIALKCMGKDNIDFIDSFGNMGEKYPDLDVDKIDSEHARYWYCSIRHKFVCRINYILPESIGMLPDPLLDPLWAHGVDPLYRSDIRLHILESIDLYKKVVSRWL
ncbi:hypothetical protein CCP4SC76_7730004 [Gammaproteobacteria bacterium]